MITLSNWDGLQSFLAVARAGKLTVAAEILGVDHSTLSRRIARLEQQLETRLFDRGVNGYSLTSQGEQLLGFAQNIESTIHTAVADIGGSSLRAAGTVRIGSPDGFGTVFLAPRLHLLSDAHPELSIELVTMPRLFNLTKREADIAIGLARPAEGRLVSRKLTDYTLGLYGTKDYLAEHGTPRNRDALKSHRLIGYIGDMIYAPELDYLPLIAPETTPSIASSNLIAQYQMVMANCGLCILPSFMTRAEPRLKRVLADDISLTRSFWLIVHADMRDLVRIRVACDFLADQVKAQQRHFL